MFQRTTSWGLFLVMLLTVVSVSMPAMAAQDSSADRYEDPDGRFSVPVPTGWTARNVAGYGVLTDPEAEIVIAVLALDGDDLEIAINEAWQILEPGFAMRPLDIAPIPAPLPGTEEGLVITYDIGDLTGDIVQAFAVLADGVSYVMLIRADPIVAQERASQIDIIASGFTITGTEEVSIEGVAPRAFEDELAREFESYVTDAMDLLEVPGATIAVVQDGEVVWRGAYGVKELGGDEPMTPETRMMIGSTTKPMTTMMLATLVDAGVIGWDTPVVDILPSFAVADADLTPQITVQNLVCACTGVSRRDLELMFNFDELSAEDIVRTLADFEFFTPVGEAYQYSNQMVAAGGFVGAVAVHGQAADMYDAYVTEMEHRVLAPIGMGHTTFSFNETVASADYAMPHGLNLDEEYVPVPLETERWVRPIAPSAGIWSNVDDMSLFMLTLLAGGVAPDGTTVVSEENLRHTWEPQVPVNGTTDYGLGWFIESYKGQPVIHHGGNTLGFSSDFAFMPESGIGIVVLTNGQGATLFVQALRYRLLELMFDLEPEIESRVEAVLAGEAQAPSVETGAPTPAATPVVETGPINPVAVAPFLGVWENEALGRVTLALEGEQFILDAGEFQTALREVPNLIGMPGVTIYLTAEPPLAGMPVELRTDVAGQASVTIGDGAYTYVFVQMASPVAMPLATPAD